MCSHVPACISLRGINKFFTSSGIVANDEIHLDFWAGEIHAIIGENGTGKSTLMHIISGNLRPDSGQLYIEGNETSFASPAEAYAAGIGMVYQDVPVFPEMTVFENIVLGSHSVNPLPRSMKKERRKITELYAKLGLESDLDHRISALSASELVKTSLISLLYRNVKVFILDEPSATFTPDEVTNLFALLTSLSQDRKAVVLITHKLKEVFAVADRVSVMRRGRIVFTGAPGSTNETSLMEYMVGSPAENSDSPMPRIRDNSGHGETVLQLKDIGLVSKNHKLLDGVNITVRRGTVVTVTGIRETGLVHIEKIVSGITRPTTGIIEYFGKALHKLNPTIIRSLGIGIVPTERASTALCSDLSVAENTEILNRKEISNRGILHREKLISQAKKSLRWILSGDSQRDTIDPRAPISRLSGGNKQKVILTREVSWARDMLIISEPFWGLDFRSREKLKEVIYLAKSRGLAILTFCADIDDAVDIGDIIVVVYRGKIVATVSHETANRELLGKYILGYRVETQ